MQLRLLNFASIGLLLHFLFPSGLAGNDAELLYNAHKAIVHVLAETSGVYNAGQEAVQDPETGKIYVMTNLVGATEHQKGLGVIVNSAGIIATNLHVVHAADHVTVTLHDEKQFPAEVIYINMMKDLCLLRIKSDEPLSQIEFADSDFTKEEGNVYALGSVERSENSVNTGKIVYVEKKKPGTDGNVNSIQVTFHSEMVQGDSGRPIFDESGKCIGLIAAGALLSRHNVFAIPSNMIKDAYLRSKNST